MLWLSVYLTQLALELVARGISAEEPLAVVERHGNRQWIHARNRTAARHGITPGMPLSAALSLYGALRWCPRDALSEHAALENLAAWASQFTSLVSLHPPCGLLLEVAGSLSLFGGLQPLEARIREGVAALGYSARLAVAPTPEASWLFARGRMPSPVLNRKALEETARALPLSILEIPRQTCTRLNSMGLRRLGDCLGLPRRSLGRRLGPGFLAYVDRVLGRAPDPRMPFRLPDRFHGHIVLPAQVEHTEALLFAAHRLLGELHGFLLARGQGLQELVLELSHPGGTVTRAAVGLMATSRETGHLLSLLHERLERLELPAPVESISLRAEKLLPMREKSGDLFAQPVSGQQDWLSLLERLQARLGPAAARGLTLGADHRPEYGTITSPPGTRQTSLRFPLRPLWLLPQPLRLQTRNNRPWHEGRLRLHSGPERIESGWWDGHDVTRDYFVAENPRHQRLWIFRELRTPGAWFLHGIFA